MKWNYKLLGKNTGVQGQSAGDETAQVSYNDNQKLVRHELYIPPKLSLCDYFLKKVCFCFTFNFIEGYLQSTRKVNN